jgi:hypothetical protein
MLQFGGAFQPWTKSENRIWGLTGGLDGLKGEPVLSKFEVRIVLTASASTSAYCSSYLYRSARDLFRFLLLGCRGAPCPPEVSVYRSVRIFRQRSQGSVRTLPGWHGVTASLIYPIDMPRPTNKPPPAEWERLKDVILSLTANNSWRDVAETMEKEHNFVAM